MAQFERKSEDGGAPEVTKKDVENVMTAFTEFKSTNDQRIAELEKKGATDPVITDKLVKIETSLSAYEGLNQRLTLAEKTAQAVVDAEKRLGDIETAIARSTGTSKEEKQNRTGEWARAVVSAHTMGVVNLSAAEQKSLKTIADEYKALSITPDTAGGYLAPIEYVREIIKTVTEISPSRALARVRTTAGKGIQLPIRTGQFAARRTGEKDLRTETAGLTYGLEEITAPEMYAIVLITNQMLEDSAFSMETEISMEATEQFALREGMEFVNGGGGLEMSGFIVNPDVEAIHSGASTTVTADGMISTKYSLKTNYAANATWLLNRTVMGSVRKLKDLNGQYLWMPGIAQGRPNTIDGDPYVEMPDMPNEGAGLKPVAYGDFKRGYVMVDRLAMEMMRDPYTGADDGVIKFRMRRRVGGQVTLPEAMKTMVCST